MIPKLEDFEAAVRKYKGNMSRVAEAFGVARSAVDYWKKSSPEYEQVVKDARMRLFDSALQVGEIVALGIPERDEKGNLVGWVERPDSNMLRYLISCLGRHEGFGENLDITTNGKDLNNVIQVEVIDKRSQVISNEENEDSDNEGV